MAFLNETKAQIGHPLFQLAEATAKRAARLQNRRKLRALLDLSDHLLRDIGVTRDQVHRATESPLSRDATDELQRLSLTRPGPWM